MNLLTDSREGEPAVPAGTKSLDEAYNDVQIAINDDTIRLRKLRDVRPDDAAGNRRWSPNYHLPYPQ